MITLHSIEQFDNYFKQPTLHQLVSVGNLSAADPSLFQEKDFGAYCIILLDSCFGNLYKCNKPITYKEGTIVWFRPGQWLKMELNQDVKPEGMMLVFREELLEKSGLGRDFYMFDFFNHDVDNALELSEAERNVIYNCFANISAELLTQRDYLTNHMIRLNIGQMLSYCKRYFERQYEQRRASNNNDIISRLDMLIDNYLSSGLPEQKGQPTVAWCADQFNLSANYFGELVKREIHITAQKYVQNKIITAAQHLLSNTTMTINEIAAQLGFAYTTHFARMFNRHVGMTPLTYRKMVNNGKG